MNKQEQAVLNLNKELLEFLKNSPTPFHAVSNMSEILQKKGFEELSEKSDWSLKKGGKYFVTRNGSSIIAFKYGKKYGPLDGIRMMGAHTDSPCLKVKPTPEKYFKNYMQLGVEIYGGALLNPWFDRDLSMAGRISYINKKDAIESTLVDFKRPVAFIPNLAIHLDRTANESKVINKQKELPPLIFQVDHDQKKLSFTEMLQDEADKKKKTSNIKKILDFEIYLYDTLAPALVGLSEQFIASARLDNLLSCFIGLKSLLNSPDDLTTLLVCNDHEEVGSASSAGAQGPMLKHTLQRICAEPSEFSRMIENSMMISVDNAHGVHPNYSDRHDENHGPLLNHGPVIKTNCNQRYATNSDTSAIFSYICEKQQIPYQKFVVRSDMACGSTIGPITASVLGVKTIDIGLPTFGMHSIRELAGAKDPYYLFLALGQFLKEKSIL